VAGTPAIPRFQARSMYWAGGRGASAVAHGDFDHDGHMDLAVALSGQREPDTTETDHHDQVVILLANPSNPGSFLRSDDLDPGTKFEAADNVKRFDVSNTAGEKDSDPVALLCVDLDQDASAIPEIVVANAKANSVTVIWSPDGSTTTSHTPYDLPSGATNPRDLAAGDFDHDGWTDIAVACGTSPAKVVVFRNVSGGGPTGRVLQNETESPYTLTKGSVTGNFASAIGVYAIPNDTTMDDLVVTTRDEATNGHLWFLRRKLNTWDKFNVLAQHAVPVKPVDLAVADVFSDSGVELLIVHDEGPAQQPSETLTIVYAPTSTTLANKTYDVREGCSGVAVGFFDGDTSLDVAVLHPETYTIQHGSFLTILRKEEAAYVFAPPVHYHTSLVPLGLTVFDFNEDGEDDVAVPGSYFDGGDANPRPEPAFVSVHMNDAQESTGRLVSDIRVPYTRETEADELPTPHNVSAFGRRNFLENLNPGTYAASDSYLDSVVAAKNTENVVASMGKGDGSFGSSLTSSTLTERRFEIDLEGRNPKDLAYGDFDADGDPDFATANTGIPGTSWVKNFWVENSGAMEFSAPHHMPGHPTLIGFSPASIVFANVDGGDDDHLEMMVGATRNYLGARTHWLLVYDWIPGDCSGTPCIVEHFELKGSVELTHPLHDLEVGDIDADGYTDIAVALRGLKSDGSEADDDCEDLEVTGASFGGVAVVWGRVPQSPYLDGWAFESTVTYAPDSEQHVRDPRNVLIDDLIPDGGNDRLDVVAVSHCNDRFVVFENTGSRQFSRRDFYEVGGFPNSIVSGDLNGDGRPDLAVNGEVSNNVAICLARCEAVGGFWFEPPFFIGDGPKGYYLYGGRVDGDETTGTFDIVSVSRDSDSISTLLNLGVP